jgi:excisionase family DNA binding protein
VKRSLNTAPLPAFLNPERSGQDDLCNTKEAARILRSLLPTIYYLAQKKLLPAMRVGGRWRFHREQFMQMVSSPKVFVQKRPPDSLNESLTRHLAAHIARAIVNAGLDPANAKPQDVAICFVTVQPQPESKVLLFNEPGADDGLLAAKAAA